MNEIKGAPSLQRDSSSLTTGDQTGMPEIMPILLLSWPTWGTKKARTMHSLRSRSGTSLETLAGVTWLALVSTLHSGPTAGEALAVAPCLPLVDLQKRTAHLLTHKPCMELSLVALTAMINTMTQGTTTFPTRWLLTTMLESRVPWLIWP